MVVGEEVTWQVLPRGIWHTSWEHRLDCLLGLMLDTNLALINIISDVCIYPRPVDGGLGWVSHLFYSSVVVVEIIECPLIKL